MADEKTTTEPGADEAPVLPGAHGLSSSGDGSRINVELSRGDWDAPKPMTITCVQCRREHRRPRRGDSIACECGLVFW